MNIFGDNVDEVTFTLKLSDTTEASLTSVAGNGQFTLDSEISFDSSEVDISFSDSGETGPYRATVTITGTFCVLCGVACC